MADAVNIGGRLVGPGHPCFVVAEVGVNHNGDPDLAERLVDAAADAGADAVKFQTFAADGVVAATAAKAPYQVERTDESESQLEMLRGLELGAGDFERIVRRCRDRGLVFLSTPFDTASIELLVRLGAPALKIASPDLTNALLVEPAAATGLPLILSTGLADLAEVEEGVAVARAAGASELVVLHCVTAYPAPIDEVNLRAMGTLAERFDVPIGYSDHTTLTVVALAAVALGACLLEKHLTLDRTLPGPDHAASLEPDEFAGLVRAVRAVESALGDGVKRPAPSEEENRVAVRRSLAAACDLVAGTVLSREMLTALRPATGIPPSRLGDVLGKTLARDVEQGELLSPAMLA
jgi:N-acetylneuraminate synthase/N,N'-diacetyllegionaminate synthase